MKQDGESPRDDESLREKKLLHERLMAGGLANLGRPTPRAMHQVEKALLAAQIPGKGRWWWAFAGPVAVGAAVLLFSVARPTKVENEFNLKAAMPPAADASMQRGVVFPVVLSETDRADVRQLESTAGGRLNSLKRGTLIQWMGRTISNHTLTLVMASMEGKMLARVDVEMAPTTSPAEDLIGAPMEARPDARWVLAISAPSRLSDASLAELLQAAIRNEVLSAGGGHIGPGVSVEVFGLEWMP